MNPIVVAVILMLVLALARVHVVVSLMIAALAGGLLSGMSLATTIKAFESGLAGGASIALSYILLGAFAAAIIHSGLPEAVARRAVRFAQGRAQEAHWLKWGIIAAIIAMSVMSQNLVPIHIAFIPMLIPPLLPLFDRLRVDRRLLACAMTFGLVTTYMFLPYGFGEQFLRKILLFNISQSGLDVIDFSNAQIMQAMLIPALGMFAGLLIALAASYRRPRDYGNAAAPQEATGDTPAITPYRSLVAVIAIVVSFLVQIFAGSLMAGALAGFAIFVVSGVVHWRDSDAVFNRGLRMMAMIGFIMIAAQGFAAVVRESGQITPLVASSVALFGGSKGLAAFVMLLVGLLITMGIGSSFSTLPIIAAVYVPLCLELGFSPLATIALIGSAGALGDCGSPASDSTLGPTMGLNTDGRHDHIRDTVIPTFLHFNLPLLLAGWLAAMIL
ncbi:MAG: Na+/H+ antiporter NhaC family protein [Cardiobacteriaceae bacterium]|nr:Na+/H+ antiporter NhaC family protein [Cardiobacteriaceae bacterium]